MCDYIHRKTFLILYLTIDIYFIVFLFVYSVAEIYKLSTLQIVYNLMMEIEKSKYIEM